MGVSSLAAVTHGPKVLALRSCSHLRFQPSAPSPACARGLCSMEELRPSAACPRKPGAGIWKKPFYCGVGAPIQIVLLLGSSAGTKCVTKPYIKEHPTPLSSSLKELARTILQGGASQTSQPHKHPNTLLEDVLSSRHG